MQSLILVGSRGRALYHAHPEPEDADYDYAFFPQNEEERQEALNLLFKINSVLQGEIFEMANGAVVIAHRDMDITVKPVDGYQFERILLAWDLIESGMAKADAWSVAIKTYGG